MFKPKIRIIDIFIGLAIIAADIFVYIIFGLLLMGYDDSWDSSKGEYWSLASMNNSEKIIYLGLGAWNIINIVGAIYIGQKIYKRIKNNA